MKRDWKPGDMVMVEGKAALRVDGSYVSSKRGPHWAWEHGGFTTLPLGPIRPLVVIDPEDREQLERLEALILRLRCRCGRLWLQESPLCEWHKSRHDRAVESRTEGSFEGLADALREFADPKPPKPEEPTGLGAVVEDETGRRWVRINTGDHPWVLTPEGPLGSNCEEYEFIAAVRVLSEGVTP